MSIWDLTEEDKKSMNVAGFSMKALDLFNDPEHLGELENPSVCHTGVSPQGERLRFCVKIINNRIKRVSYTYQGCPALSITAAATIKVVLSKSVNNAQLCSENDIWQILESLPPGHEEHVAFSLTTMKETLDIFTHQKRLTPEKHEIYKHLCGLTGKEIDKMEIVPCSECSLVQNCENDHIII